MKIDIQEIARVLREAPFHYLGLTAVPMDPPADPPCAVFTERNLNAFHYALEEAHGFWPAALHFAIVGSNSVVHPQTASQFRHGTNPFPPGLQRLQAPQVLLVFEK